MAGKGLASQGRQDMHTRLYENDCADEMMKSTHCLSAVT